MAVFKCKMCGGDLQVNENISVGECSYCGTHQTLPRIDDDKRANLYDRANHFRRNGEFDKAAAIYDTILNDDKTDAEAYWSLVLCKYGIEYVEDSRSHKRIPTCNRTQFTSIFADEDYKQAIANANASAKAVYETEAKVIDEIQKGILNISAKEEPFDVFICYKESDQNGRRTLDSVLAQDLYFQLKQEGFKVFFSRITLEDKLGTAYEPYIFAALNSSKVMVVIGTKSENFNSPWVKNEWSRYLSSIKNGAKKSLIPAYKDMDPYDLPEEFSHLQAQDMSKLGFMQDLIRGIKKIVAEGLPKVPVKESINTLGNVSTALLLKRAFICLEDGDFQKADELLEQVLNLDPEISKAYVGKLMAEMQIREVSEIPKCTIRIENNSNFKKAIRFADEVNKNLLLGYSHTISTRVLTPEETLYNEAVKMLENGVFAEAIKILDSLGIYYDSREQLQKAKYDYAMKLASDRQYAEAISTLNSIGDYKDSTERIEFIIAESYKVAAVGDIIFIGNYQQRSDDSAQKEPIPWVILDKKYDELLLITQKIIDCVPFHNKQENISWENCFLREWLNNYFYNSAFTNLEKKYIAKKTVPNFMKISMFGYGIGSYYTEDNIFILSKNEAAIYFEKNEKRYSNVTDYAHVRGASTNNIGIGLWWLRSPGLSHDSKEIVSGLGEINGFSRSVTSEFVGVRPALWLDLKTISFNK